MVGVEGVMYRVVSGLLWFHVSCDVMYLVVSCVMCHVVSCGEVTLGRWWGWDVSCAVWCHVSCVTWCHVVKYCSGGGGVGGVMCLVMSCGVMCHLVK